MKRLAILGSTGSIGVNTLNVARHLKDEVCIEALAAKSNIDLLEQQVKEFKPKIIAVFDSEKALELQRRLPKSTILTGMDGLNAVASYPSANLVISAMTGTLGLIPTMKALESRKNVGLANKEALVSGGSLVMSLAESNGCKIIPIDSEHSALFQCLKGEEPKTVHRLILTASGGPFRNYTAEQLSQITVDCALRHPTWSMGPKVTIDSSTLMNKGLEVIEAYWLFGIPIEKIEVVVHPQSLIHSIVEFVDGSMLAQMSEPSMIVPIQYAITYPERRKGIHPYYDFLKNPLIQFFPPDVNKFPCLQLAYDAIRTGGSLPCYMNAANEVLVNRFIARQFSWQEIPIRLEKLMTRHQTKKISSLEDVLAVDEIARQEAIL